MATDASQVHGVGRHFALCTMGLLFSYLDTSIKDIQNLTENIYLHKFDMYQKQMVITQSILSSGIALKVGAF